LGVFALDTNSFGNFSGNSEGILLSSSDRATYIRDTLVEIRRFAEDEKLGFLRYLLSMALEEANVSVVVTAPRPEQSSQ
jgi:hypothetical protein